MVLNRFLAIFALVGLAFATVDDEYRPACQAVEAAISNASKVYYSGESGYYRGVEVGPHTWIGDPLYTKGEYHFFASSQQDPACVVEPGTPEDVGKVVRSSRSASFGIVCRFRSRFTPSFDN